MAANPERRATIYQLIAASSAELDVLAAEVSVGIRSAGHYNDLEARAKAIANGLTNAFRKGRV